MSQMRYSPSLSPLHSYRQYQEYPQGLKHQVLLAQPPAPEFTAVTLGLTIIYNHYHLPILEKRTSGSNLIRYGFLISHIKWIRDSIRLISQVSWLRVAAKAASSLLVATGPQGGRTFQKSQQQLKKAWKMIFSERCFKKVQNKRQSVSGKRL